MGWFYLPHTKLASVWGRLKAEAIISFLKRKGVLAEIGEYGRQYKAPVFYVGAKSTGKNYLTGIGVHRDYGKALYSSVMELLERVALGESTISGVAIAENEDSAFVFAIYELIERDAFLLHWLKKITPPQIELERIKDGEVRFLIEEAKKRNLKPFLLDITSDVGVPTYLAAFVQENPPLISRGSSSNLNPLSAVKKAFYEAWGNYVFNSYLLKQEERIINNESRKRPILSRYILWTKPASFQEFSFLLRGPSRQFKQRPGIKDEIGRLNDILKISYYRLQNPLLNKLGLNVVKVAIPALIPFYFEEKDKDIASRHPRLRGKILNDFPHPFA